MWTHRCGRLPLGFRNEQLQIPVVRSVASLRFSHMTGRLPLISPVELSHRDAWTDERLHVSCPQGRAADFVPDLLNGSSGKRDFAISVAVSGRMAWAPPRRWRFDEDLDRVPKVLRARRPKTKVSIELLLLLAVAKALTAYLRWERPPAKPVHLPFPAQEHALRTGISSVKSGTLVRITPGLQAFRPR